MNKHNMIPAAVLAVISVSMMSCALRDGLPEERLDDDPVVTCFEATVRDYAMDGVSLTKAQFSDANEFAWEEGDCLDMWPSAADLYNGETPSKVTFRATAGGSSSATFEGNGWGMLRGNTYYASYPAGGRSTCDRVYLSWDGQWQTGDNDASHLGGYAFLHTTYQVPSTGPSSISFSRVGSFAKFAISVPSGARDKLFTEMTLHDDTAVFLHDAWYDPREAEVVLQGDLDNDFTVNLAENGVPGVRATDGVLTVYCIMAPAAWKGHNVTVSLKALDETEYDMTIVPKKDQVSGSGYSYSSTLSFQPEAVDLGLSVKWSYTNLGATEPEQFGDYYAWGETRTKSRYDERGYCWYDASSGKYSKYNATPQTGTFDKKAILDPEDDAAKACWGDKWRMPTEEEFRELLEKCTLTASTENGVQGYTATSNVPGYEGVSIFLPLAGHLYGTEVSNPNMAGNYLSSTLQVSNENNGVNVAYLYLQSGADISRTNRFTGHSIRPVYGDFVPATKVTMRESVVNVGGGTCQLEATVEPGNCSSKRLVWSADDPDAATVKDNGTVSLQVNGPGYATVTASWGGDSEVCARCLIVRSSHILPSGYEFNNCLARVAGGLDNIRKIVFETYTSSTEGTAIGDGFYMSYDRSGVVTVRTAERCIYANPDCSRMFSDCYNLVEIDGLDKFNTAGVTTMGSMFCDCPKLESLDLRSFDTRNVTVMGYMFERCERLRELFLGENFIITEQCHATNHDEMFQGDYSLTIYGTSATPENFMRYLVPGNINDYVAGCLHFAVDMGDAGWWSAWNIGADRPSGLGDFFSWGNSEAHWHNGVSDGYVFSRDAYRSTSGSSMTDDWREVPSVYPVWGGDIWRMPRVEDLTRLCDCCTHEETAVDGQPGIMFTCPSTGNSIFLPAGGFIADGTFGQGREAYWLADLGGTESAYCQYGIWHVYGNRYCGRSIRPVAKYGTRYVTAMSISPSTLTLHKGSGAGETYDHLTVNREPQGAFDSRVTWASSDTGVATVRDGVVTAVAGGRATITATNTATGVTASCAVTVVATTGTAEVDSGSGRRRCDWVQLWEGGPKFATFNVGAGQYSYLSIGTDNYPTYDVGGLYPWHHPATDGRVNEIAGTPERTGDVAAGLWGSNWREPTSSEMSDLRDGVGNHGHEVTGGTATGVSLGLVWTWCDGSVLQYVQGCPLKGFKVSGKVGTPYEGNSIFLPAGGIGRPLQDVGTTGCYWTSERGTGGNGNAAVYLRLDDSSVATQLVSLTSCCSVRPVLVE